MSIVVNNNIASLIAQRNLTSNSSNLAKSIERLSSGYRINKAADDAAGLSISEGLRGQIRGNKQALSNIQDGINLLQTAEGSLSTISESLQRVRELCVQAANDTNGTTEREAILTEIKARLADIDRVSNSTKFNSISVFQSGSDIKLQIGANSLESTNVLPLDSVLTGAKIADIGLDDLEALNITGANWNKIAIRSYLDQVDAAISNIVTRRSNIGAYQNRLDSALENLTLTNENLQSAESRIRDLDIASETSAMTKYQILQQASASVLAQANSIPQLALQLLQG